MPVCSTRWLGGPCTSVETPHRDCSLSHSLLTLVDRVSAPRLEVADFPGQKQVRFTIDGPLVFEARITEASIDIGEEAQIAFRPVSSAMHTW